MLFLNEGNPVKVRKENSDGFYWVTVGTNKTVDLPENVGESYGFKKFETVESDVHKKAKVSTKKVSTEKTVKKNFLDSLTKIQGIGKKTAKDITQVYLTEEDLIKAIENDEVLPFRDDVVNKLAEKYGKR